MEEERTSDRDILIAMLSRAEITYDYVDDDGSLEIEGEPEWEDVDGPILAFVFNEHGDLMEVRVEQPE